MVLAYSDRIPRVPPYSGYSLLLNSFTYGAFTLSCRAFQHCSVTILNGFWSPSPQKYYYSWFGLFRFRSPLLSESLFYFLFLRVIRCFSSPGSLHYAMYLRNDTITLLMVSSLIRISTDQCLFATPRSFSQLVTSFFGAMYQGILLYALCSLIFLSQNCISNSVEFLYILNSSTFALDFFLSESFPTLSFCFFVLTLFFLFSLFALCLNVLSLKFFSIDI